MPSYRLTAKNDDRRLLRDDMCDIDPYAGRVVGGRFALVSPVTSGCRSYLAYDALDGRVVEVHIGRKTALSEFHALVETSATVDHPRVLSYIAWGVHSCGVDGLIAYVACEYIPSAMALDEYRTLSGPLDEEEIEELLEAVADTIEICRRAGVEVRHPGLADVLVTSVPGWPRMVKLRATPAHSEALLCRGDDVREIELPEFESPTPEKRGRNAHNGDLEDLADRLR